MNPQILIKNLRELGKSEYVENYYISNPSETPLGVLIDVTLDFKIHVHARQAFDYLKMSPHIRKLRHRGNLVLEFGVKMDS